MIGTAGTAKGRELVLREGANAALDHTAPDYLEKLMALTEARGVDVILEMASHLNLGKDLTVLAKGGRVVVIGCRGPVEINPRDLMSREAAVLGLIIANATDEEARTMWTALEAGFADGTLKPVVAREFPMAEAAKAHQAVMEPGALGKIVLTV